MITDNYKTPEDFERLRDLGFRCVAKDLFTAPDTVKAYLCRQYRLHLTPIFAKRAEANLDE